MWVYYETDGDAGWYNVRLFSRVEYAEQYKVRVNDAYGGIAEINVDEGVITGKNKPVEDLKCPDCDGEMVSRKSQYGTFWGCRKFPKCRGTRDTEGRSKEEAAAARKAEGDASVEDMQSDSKTVLQNDQFRFRKS